MLEVSTDVIASQRVGANGSRECAPDDRLREAIQKLHRGKLDCFVALLLGRKWDLGNRALTHQGDIDGWATISHRRNVSSTRVGQRAGTELAMTENWTPGSSLGSQ